MSPRPSRPPHRPTLIANPSTRSPGWIYPLLATLAIVTALALVLAIVTPAGWQNPRTGLSGTNGPVFTPTTAEPLPGTPTDDLTSDPGLSALSTDEAIRAEWLTPTATTVPSSTAVPLDWCSVTTPEIGRRCRVDLATAEIIATLKPVQPTMTVWPCRDGLPDGSVCEFAAPASTPTPGATLGAKGAPTNAAAPVLPTTGRS